MEGFCNRCGDCCERISTIWSHQDIIDKTEEDDPNRFVLEHWKLIDEYERSDGEMGTCMNVTSFKQQLELVGLRIDLLYVRGIRIIMTPLVSVLQKLTEKSARTGTTYRKTNGQKE